VDKSLQMGKEGGTLCLCGAEPTLSHSKGAEEEATAVRKVGGDKSWPRYGLGSGKFDGAGNLDSNGNSLQKLEAVELAALGLHYLHLIN
jgi:hypothetical protein